MASSKKRVVFKIEGEYDNSSLRALKQDVDNLSKIDAFIKMRQDFAATSKVFADAKENARALREQLKAGGGAEIASQYAAAKNTVKELGKSLDQQRNALRSNGEALRQSGVDTSKLAAEEDSLAAALKGQKEAWAAQAAVMKSSSARQEASAKQTAASFEKTTEAVGEYSKEIDRKNAAEEESIKQGRKIITVNNAVSVAYASALYSMGGYAGKMSAITEIVNNVIRGRNENINSINRETESLFSLSSALRSYIALASSGAASLISFKTAKEIAATVAGYNATLESSRTGLAAVIRTFDQSNDSVAKYNHSVYIAVKIQKRLQIEGLKTIATYKDLLVALQEGIGPALRRNFEPEQIVKFVSAMIKAAAGLSVPMNQLGQELRAILDGTIDKNARIAQSLQITNAEVKEMAAQGKLYDYLSDRLSAFAIAGDEAAKQWTGAVSNLQDAVQTALGIGFKGSFDQATKLVLRLTDAIVQIDEESAKFTFNEKISALLKDFDKRVSDFLKNITTESIKKKIEVISLSLMEVLKVIFTVAKAGKYLTEILSPVLPVLAKISTYFLLIWVPAYAAAKAVGFFVTTTVLAIAKLGFAFVRLYTVSTLFQGIITTALRTIALAFGAALSKITIGFAAFYAAYKAGNWIVMHKEIAAVAEATALLEKQTKKLDKRLQEVSKTTGIAFDTWEDFERAEKAGIVFFNEQTGAWEKSNKKRQQAAAAAAESTKSEKKRLAELKKEYDDLVKEIEKVGDELVKLADEGAADQLKLANASRTPIEAWEAQKQAAIDIGPAMAAAATEAKKLAAAGDIEGANKSYARAVELGKQMRDGFKELAREVKAEWTPAMEQSLDKAKEKSKEFGEQYKESFDAAKKAGEDLKKTTEQLVAAEDSLKAALRDQRREGMTTAQAYQDLAAEQSDFEAASKAAQEAGAKAAAAGNLEQAQQYYDFAIQKAQEARQAAGELNQEVLNGEKVVVSAERARANAYAADISARQLEIEAIKAKQSAEAQAQAEAAALAAQAKAAEDAAKAEAEALAAEKEKIVKTEAEAAQEAAKLEAEARQQITEILKEQQELLKTLADQKNEEADFTLGDTFTEAGEQAKNLYELNQKIAEQLKIVADESAAGWQRSFAATEAAGLEAAAAVDAALNNAARDRTSTITTYVKEVQQNYSGGIAQRFRDGGIPVKFNPSAARVIRPGTILPGFGGQDRIPAMMRDGEGVLNPHAVRALSPAGFHDLNKLRFERVAARLQGMGRRQPKIATVLPALRADSGSLGVAKKEKTIRVVFEDKASGMVAAGTMNSNADLQKLLKMQTHQALVSSR